MAVLVTIANRFMYYLALKKFDFSVDNIKCCLMQSGFTFNRDTHHKYADVSASGLATGNGYTAGGKLLTGVTVTEDDVNDKTVISCDDIQWTASGGAIGPAAGAILYDDLETDKSLIGYIDFGTDRTAADGADFNINNVKINIRKA